MSIPLDPVILRNNYLHAYGVAAGKAQLTLNEYIKNSNPFSKVGDITQEVKIERYNSIGANSYEFIWRQQTYNEMGKETGIKRYSGVFTVKQGKVSKNLQQLLI